MMTAVLREFVQKQDVAADEAETLFYTRNIF